jgi:hypothetical protein
MNKKRLYVLIQILIIVVCANNAFANLINENTKNLIIEMIQEFKLTYADKASKDMDSLKFNIDNEITIYVNNSLGKINEDLNNFLYSELDNASREIDIHINNLKLEYNNKINSEIEIKKRIVEQLVSIKTKELIDKYENESNKFDKGKGKNKNKANPNFQ